MTLHIILAILGYYLFSAMADAMLPPLPGRERTFYGWLYRFTQSLAANTSKLAEQRFGIPEVLPKVQAGSTDWVAGEWLSERRAIRRVMLAFIFAVIAFIAAMQHFHPQTQHQPAPCLQEAQ